MKQKKKYGICKEWRLKKLARFALDTTFMVIILIPPQQTAFDGEKEKERLFSFFLLTAVAVISYNDAHFFLMNSNFLFTMTITFLPFFFVLRTFFALIILGRTKKKVFPSFCFLRFFLHSVDIFFFRDVKSFFFILKSPKENLMTTHIIASQVKKVNILFSFVTKYECGAITEFFLFLSLL